MTNPQTLKKIGSMVCLGSNGFTVLENKNRHWGSNDVLDHKTGEKMHIGLWAEIMARNVELNSFVALKQKLKNTNCYVDEAWDPNCVTPDDGFTIEAYEALCQHIAIVFLCLICEEETLREQVKKICYELKEFALACNEQGEEIDIEHCCPTLDKIIEDFKSLGVEFKD